MKILGMHIGIWYINIGTPFAEDMVGEWACAWMTGLYVYITSAILRGSDDSWAEIITGRRGSVNQVPTVQYR